MTERISTCLADLANEVIRLKGQEKIIDFGEGTDYQGELSLSWHVGKFHASLHIFYDPYTSGGGWFGPPETDWREDDDEFESVKIVEVSKWLKRDWGFDLINVGVSA